MNLNSARLPRLFTYEQAFTHYNDVVPYRSGHKKFGRPLGNRRYTYLNIDKIEGTNVIALQLYGSDVVTFYPNGEIHVSLCKYDTIGTRQFIFATTPYNTSHIRGTTYLNVGEGWYAFADAETPLVILDDKVKNPAQQLTYKVNRAAMKDLHKKYGAFREYVSTMGKILTAITDVEVLDAAKSGRIPSEGEPQFVTLTTTRAVTRIILPTAKTRYYHGLHKPRETVAAFLTEVCKAQEADDLERYRDLFLHLGSSSLRYNSFVHAFTVGWRPDDEIAIGPQMLMFFDEMLKHHYREEVFVKTEVPIGVKVNNANSKYFD